MEELLLHVQQPGVGLDGGLGFWFFFFCREREKLASVICEQNVVLDHLPMAKAVQQPGLVLRAGDAAYFCIFQQHW